MADRPRRRIAELAEPRRITLPPIAGEVVCVVEPDGLLYGDYKNLRAAGQRREAIALLIENCVEEPGVEGVPYFTHEEAMMIAKGRSEVFAPLVIALTGFLKTEKKLSTPSSDSSTDLQPPSAAPSGKPSAA